MIKPNKYTLLFAFILAVGVMAGLVVAGTVGMVPPSVSQEKATPPRVADHITPGRALADQLSELFETASASISPSVVPIFSEQEENVTNPLGSAEDPFRDFFGDDFFKRFFYTPRQDGHGPETQKQIVRGLGSGVIVSADGYILTNNHVVDGAEKLTVVTSDQKKYTARVIGTDPQTDVAVIKIDARNLPAVTLGNSDDAKVGQWVIAVGNPFQLLHTVTAGIISAKGRSSVGLAEYEDFIQTDASINPGNSGGALADLDGNVIGINTAISSPSGGNVGIGFAIPINMAKQVMDGLIKAGKITRGYLALVPQDIDENLAKALKLKGTKGALVGDVTADGPAAKAGIKPGDIITSFNGHQISGSTELRNLVAQSRPGTSAKIAILRDAREMEVTAILGERPRERGTRESREEQQPDEQRSGKLGLSVQKLTSDIAEELGYQNEHGVVITDVAAGSPAEESGLQPGDLIKEANRTPVRTIQDFNRVTAHLTSGESIALLVRRGENSSYVAIQIP